MAKRIYIPPNKNAPVTRRTIVYTAKAYRPDEAISCKQFVETLTGPENIYTILVNNRMRGMHATYGEFLQRFEALKAEKA